MNTSFAPRSDQEGFIRLSLIQPFLEKMKSEKISTRRAFAELGMDEASAFNPNVFVHAEIVYGIINRFSDLAADPFFGLHVGEEHDFSEWPPFTNAVGSASTLFEFFSQYVAKVPNEANSVEHTLIVGPEEASYRVQRLHRPSVPPVQVTGFACAHYVRVLRSVTSASWDPSQVTFESKHISGIPSDYADIRIRSSDDHGVRIRFPVEWLSSEFDVDIGVAKHAPRQQHEKVTVVAALRSVLANHLDEPSVNLLRAAELLGLDGERLAKALKRSGTTVAKVHRELKIEAAKVQLQEGDVAIGEVGASIGYTYPGHFTRFFRSQTGMSPIEYQRQHQEK